MTHISSQLIFEEGAKAIEWRKEKSFQPMVPEQLDILMQLKKKKNLDICSGQNQIIRCCGVEILHEMPEWGY